MLITEGSILSAGWLERARCTPSTLSVALASSAEPLDSTANFPTHLRHTSSISGSTHDPPVLLRVRGERARGGRCSIAMAMLRPLNDAHAPLARAKQLSRWSNGSRHGNRQEGKDVLLSLSAWRRPNRGRSRARVSAPTHAVTLPCHFRTPCATSYL